MPKVTNKMNSIHQIYKDDDDYAPFQKWSLIANQSDVFDWQNHSFSEYNMELMMMRDSFAQSSGYDVNNLTGHSYTEHYDYWIQSIFKFTSENDGSEFSHLQSSKKLFYYFNQSGHGGRNVPPSFSK